MTITLSPAYHTKAQEHCVRPKRHTAEMRYPGAWMKARQENNPKQTPQTNARLIKAEAKRPPQTSYRRNAVSRSMDESEARKQPKTNPSDKRTPHKSRSLSGRTKCHTAEMRYPGAWMKARQENNPKQTPPTNARLIKAGA